MKTTATLALCASVFALAAGADDGDRSGDGYGDGHGGNDSPPVTSSVVGGPIPGLTQQERALFNQGKVDFEHDFTIWEGRGPLFNQPSCVGCHFAGATGGAEPSTDNNVHHLTIETGPPGPAGTVQTFLAFELGGPVRQQKTITGEPGSGACVAPPEVDPTTPRSRVSNRHTPPVFGFGLLDAVPDAEILEYEGAQPWKKRGVFGAANWGVELEGLGRLLAFAFDISRTQPIGAPRVGRFGWKAPTATLFQFTTEPFNIELGVSTPFFPRENMADGTRVPDACKVITAAQPNDVNSQKSLSLYYFQAFVGPPPRLPATPDVRKGEELFHRVGCADCHRPTLHTVRDYYAPMADGSVKRIAALSGKTLAPYSDLLIHDMGEQLKDHRPQGRASGRFWRTTPLWGIRFKSNYLHDGSATTERDATLAHGGEGTASTRAFMALSEHEKQQLEEFMESL